MRRKSFSLVLLIFIVSLVVFLVILLVSLINRPQKGKNINNQTSKTVEKKLDSAFIESLNDIESENAETEDQSSDNNDVPQNSDSEQLDDNNATSVELNNHSYKLKSEAQTSIVDSLTEKKELRYELPEKSYVIQYGSIADINFQDFKSTDDLKSYIETEYGVTLTSSLKTGKISELDLVICSASEDSKQIYLLFTPLTDSETAYAKIYNKANENELLNDIAEPLNEISSIISSKE